MPQLATPETGIRNFQRFNNAKTENSHRTIEREEILNSLCFQCPKCVTCEKCRKLLALIVEANKEWLEQYKESLEEMEGSWTISGATTLCNNLLKE